MKRFSIGWGIGTLCVGWALAQPTSAAAQNRGQVNMDKLPPILRLAVRKQPQLRFSGTRVVEQLIGPDRQRHVEYVIRDGGKTRIWFPRESAYAGQVIVENLRQRKHYFPGKNEIKIGPAAREEAFGRLLQMVARGSIRFETEQSEQIAGRPTVLVSIKESGNVLQKLWIDTGTGLILRRDLFDLVGARVGSYAFTEVDYSPNLQASDFVLERKGARTVTPRDEASTLAKQLGVTNYVIPETEGFSLDNARLLPGLRSSVLHVTFSKGPTVVSLFNAKGRHAVPLAKKTAREGISAYSWVAGGNTLVLVGNVSESELKRLASLLTPQ